MAARVNRRSFLLAVAAGVAGGTLFDRAVNLGGSDPPDHRVWSRIEAWMEAHAPEALEVLRPGVNDESIDRAEEILELELPESFRRSLARHDGQEVRWPSLVEFGFLMPLQQVVDRLAQPRRVVRAEIRRESSARVVAPGVDAVRLA